MGRVKTVDWKILLLTALAAFIGSIGQLEFKRGADNLQFDIKLLLTNYHLIIAIAVYCVSTVFYVYALNKEQLSILYPIIATSYIWTLLFSKIFLKEPVGLTSWAGVFFILLGVTLIATQAGR
ncbi:MAG: EamA family transporter [Candidatus Bathyarchaeota archaeon]|jgi:drug/metabolite transporter (DMT)-like permease|nr:EamA family transporter [Candidatus Bathyarchaeota archaeon]